MTERRVLKWHFSELRQKVGVACPTKHPAATRIFDQQLLRRRVSRVFFESVRKRIRDGEVHEFRVG
jgi:hypothetical protein